MEETERRKVIELFSAYYSKADFRIPAINQREFGIGNIKKIDSRHLSFNDLAEFRRYLVTNTPLFVSHSTGYYEYPSASQMERKRRIGADLIFDLDLHAEGKYDVYKRLDSVKADVLRLVKDFVLGDFGVKKEDVLIVFSGNRGYHVHVRDQRYQAIGSDERHELADYVMGQGLNYAEFFSYDDKKRLLGPKSSEGGYRGRLARSVVSVLREKPMTISRIFKEERTREFFISGINEGNWSRTSLDLKDLLSRLGPIAKDLSVMSVNTDVGVTQDMSRLIRVPQSIHGDTGFVACIVPDPEKFDPLKDALLPNIKSETLRVRFVEDVPELTIGAEARSFKKDEVRELPANIAIFYILKRSAKIEK